MRVSLRTQDKIRICLQNNVQNNSFSRLHCFSDVTLITQPYFSGLFLYDPPPHTHTQCHVGTFQYQVLCIFTVCHPEIQTCSVCHSVCCSASVDHLSHSQIKKESKHNVKLPHFCIKQAWRAVRA